MGSSSKSSRGAWVVAGLAASLLLPAAALGVTTVSFSPSTGLLVTGDAAGEGLGVTRGADRFEVFPFPTATSAAAVFVPGSGCQAQGTRIACLFAGADNRVVTANLGDGPDLLLVQGAALSPLDAVIDGGAGNDDLRGGPGSDQVRGGPGDDVLRGGAGQVNDVLEGGDGNDELVGDSGGVDTMKGEGGDDRFRALSSPPDSFPGDLFDGGPGIDVADYSARTGAVFLRISTVPTATPNDGAGAEGDDLDAVETLIGGAGGDTLEVDAPDVLTITPGPAPPPPPAGAPGVFTLRGNGGSDTLRALNRPRTSMDGGVGRDLLIGGGGEDTIFSRDGERDKIACGAALDTLTSDLKDVPVPVDCEFVNKSDRREGPNVNVLTRIARVDRAGVLRVRLACPRAVGGGCTGALVARLDRRGTRFGAEEPYSLRAGRSTVVAVTLVSGQIRGARRADARVRVRSVEAGVHGEKTTQRSLPARRR